MASPFDIDRIVEAVNNNRTSRTELLAIIAAASPSIDTSRFDIDRLVIAINNAGTSRDQLRYLLDQAIPEAPTSPFDADRIVYGINNAGQSRNQLAYIIDPTGGTSEPEEFTVGEWSVADAATDGEAVITITTLPDDGGSAITALEYRIDGGTWTALPDVTTGDYTIDGLTNGVEVDVEIRAVNAIGNSPESDTKTVTPTLVPLLLVGSTWGGVGDGLATGVSGGVGLGPNNMQNQFNLRTKYLLQPVPVPNLGQSGSSIADPALGNAWINPIAIDALIAQRPNLFIIWTMGHNDNILANPTSYSGFTDWTNAVTYAYNQWLTYAGNDRGYMFAVTGTAGSDNDEASIHRTNVWNAQKAHVAALTATDSRVVFFDNSSLIPATSYSVDAAAHTHLDERGGYAYADGMWGVISPFVENKTIDETIDLIVAGTYPHMSGAQLDADHNLAGLGGTLTGATSVGGIATTKNVTWAPATATAVAEMAVDSGSRNKIVVTLAGTSTTAGRIQVGDKANQTYTINPGGMIRAGMKVTASPGFHNFGMNAVLGAFAGGSSSIGNNTLVGTGDTHALATIFHTNLHPIFGNSPATNSTKQMALYYRSGTVFTGMTVEVSRFFAYVMSQRGQYPARYLGDLTTGAPGFAAYYTANDRITVLSAISQAAGGTLRVNPGMWVPAGLTDADFIEKRIYKGTAGDTAVGSGTQIGTDMGVGTWTQVFGAAVVTTGDRIWAEVDVLDPFDGTTLITKRCALAQALTAT